MSTKRNVPRWLLALCIAAGIPVALVILIFILGVIVTLAKLPSDSSPVEATPPLASLSPSASAAPTSSPTLDSTDYPHYGLDLQTSDPRARKFLFDFHKQFPRLVGNEPDKYLLQNGSKLCAEFSYADRHGQPQMTRTEIERYISLRSVFSQQPNQATPAESWKIAKLATKDICPEYKNHTK